MDIKKILNIIALLVIIYIILLAILTLFFIIPFRLVLWELPAFIGFSIAIYGVFIYNPRSRLNKVFGIIFIIVLFFSWVGIPLIFYLLGMNNESDWELGWRFTIVITILVMFLLRFLLGWLINKKK